MDKGEERGGGAEEAGVEGEEGVEGLGGGDGGGEVGEEDDDKEGEEGSVYRRLLACQKRRRIGWFRYTHRWIVTTTAKITANLHSPVHSNFTLFLSPSPFPPSTPYPVPFPRPFPFRNSGVSSLPTPSSGA